MSKLKYFPLVFVVWCFSFATVLNSSSLALAQTVGVDQGLATSELFESVHTNNLEAAQASVAQGADIDARDRWGMTPVEIAIDLEYFEIAHFLMSVRNFQAANEANDREPVFPPVNVAQPVVTTDTTGTPTSSESEAIVGLVSFETAANFSAGVAADPTSDAGAFGDGPAIVWPEHKPNPFDPAMPAPGSQALMAVEIGATNLADQDPFATEFGDTKAGESLPPPPELTPTQ